MAKRQRFRFRHVDWADWVGAGIFLVPMALVGAVFMYVIADGVAPEVATGIAAVWLAAFGVSASFFRQADAEIGDDGIALKVRGLPRFIAWSSVTDVTIETMLVADDLPPRPSGVRLHLGDRSVYLGRARDPLKLAAVIRERVASFQGRERAEVPASLGAPRSEGYRAPGIPPAVLVRVASDAGLAVDDRERALIALAREHPADARRLTDALVEATAEPTTRARLREALR